MNRSTIVGPRPIGWISTSSAEGLLNVAPYSFFTVFNHTPPIVGFASNGDKDSVRTIEQTGDERYQQETADGIPSLDRSAVGTLCALSHGRIVATCSTMKP